LPIIFYISAMTYGARLKEALTHAKKSRRELAGAIDQTVQSIGMVINGKAERLSTVASAKAAAFLRVDHNWLVTGRGAMIPSNVPTPQTNKLSPSAQNLGEWLDKIKDPDRHYRIAHAAMAVILEEIDGPPKPPTPARQPAKERRRVESPGR
jgi:transcriptional regulator with XRE-family HTH domain